VAQISNLYRRASGIHTVRLAVPSRLRSVVGRGEIHQSTGTRTLPVAKAVAAALIAHWREELLTLDRRGRMDIEKIVVCSPTFAGEGSCV
jgi:hypothetical protein